MRGIPKQVTRESWITRSEDLKMTILACSGLWPEPARAPLNPKVSMVFEGDGFRVSKVVFESRPGFLVTGNLYAPTGSGSTRTKSVEHLRPAVLCPHGHFDNGRLTRTMECDAPARAITFARMGYYAFSWDMLGYVDNVQLPHDLKVLVGSKAVALGINSLGLQLWNGIRAVDFILGLPGIDPRRIGCTGESGGGTQAFLLAAVDPRVSVSVPVNMVSSSFQGGCSCENAPGLRLDSDNVAFAALAAPRPMLLVSCTGDWTKDTPNLEYPEIRRVYDSMDSRGNLGWAQVDAPHNYNLETRELVYAWFARWFGAGDPAQPQYSDRIRELNQLVDNTDLLDSRGEFKFTLPEDHIRLDTDQLLIGTGSMIPEDIPSGSEVLLRVMEDRQTSAFTALADLRSYRKALARLCGIPGDWKSKAVTDGWNSISVNWIIGDRETNRITMRRLSTYGSVGVDHLVLCSVANFERFVRNPEYCESMGIPENAIFLTPEELCQNLGLPKIGDAANHPACFMPSKGAVAVSSVIAAIYAIQSQSLEKRISVTGIGGYSRIGLLARALIPGMMERFTAYFVDPHTVNSDPRDYLPLDIVNFKSDPELEIPGLMGIGGYRAALAAGEGCKLSLMG